MIEVVSTPAAVIDSTVSPSEISYLVATESPVVFGFQRKDGIITAVNTSVSPPDESVITYSDGFEAVIGDSISLYDSVNDVMINATVLSVASATEFTLDLAFDARYDTDLTYFLNLTQRANYYVECRLKVKGAYQATTMRFSPNTKGYVKADVAQFLSSEIVNDKIGNYVDNSAAETNQSGTFTFEYRERYLGDTNTWTEETNTWYYIFFVRSKEQGSNLYEYVSTATEEGVFINMFEKIPWVVGTPLDVQFWWNPVFDALKGTLKIYSAANVLLDTVSITLDNASKGYLTSVKISQDTIPALADHMTIEIEEV
jgi:hypothetical protein